MVTKECTICGKIAVCFDEGLCLFKCPYCTHTFTAASGIDPDIYSKEYFQQTHKNWFNNPNFRLFSFFHKTLRKLMPKKKIKLLDVGCGNGDFLNFISRIDPDIELYGIDLAESSSSSYHFIKGDILKEDIPMQFDVVCGHAVIEHVDNPQLFAKKLMNLVSPGGVLFLSTINNLSLTYRLARFLKLLGISAAYNQVYNKHHLQHYTNRSLRYLLETGGFQVLRQVNHNYPLKAIDIQESNPYMKKIYIAGVWLIFFLQSLSAAGIAQFVMCKKRSY